MRPSIFLFALTASGLMTLAQVGVAQEQPSTSSSDVTQPLAMPAQASTSSSAEHPHRGLTMSQVKDKFGAPSQEVSAIGTPPISRWEYPGYVVFFESDRVLHTVVTR